MKKWIIVSEWDVLEQYYTDDDIWMFTHNKDEAKQFSSALDAQSVIDELVSDQPYMDDKLSIRSTLTTSIQVGDSVKTIKVTY